MADTLTQHSGYKSRVENETTKGQHEIVFDDITVDSNTTEIKVNGFKDGVFHVKLANASGNFVSFIFQGSVVNDPQTDDDWFNMDEDNTVHRQNQNDVSQAYAFQVSVKHIRVKVFDISGETITITLYINRDS